MRILALAALLLLADAPVPVASRDPGVVRLAADAQARWVDFTLTPGNQIRFRMTVNGRPVAAILDTGVYFSLLSRTSPVTRGATIAPGGQASAIGGAVPIGWMPTRSLTLGGLTRRGGGLAVATLPALATGSAESVDLLVGRDLLAGQALDIDYAANRFRLIRSGRMPFPGKIAPLSISPARNVYESAITLGTKRFSPMIVDTGDGSSMTITEGEWRSAGLAKLPRTTAIAFGLAGPVVTGLAIVPSVRLGELNAQDVEMRIEPAGGFSETIGVAGRIGTGFLSRYRVLLDPRAGRMVLNPRPDMPPVLRSTSGLLLGLERDRLKVLHVMRGGPAETSGWAIGDTICAVDGQPIGPDYTSSPLARWSAGAPGTVVMLTPCSGRPRKLVLRRFY